MSAPPRRATDRELVDLLQEATAVEHEARDRWEDAAKLLDNAERESAVVVMRHAVALKRSIEQWMVSRSTRSAGQQPRV